MKHTTKNYKFIINSIGNFELYSYDTFIARFNPVASAIFVSKYYDYSQTTKRHLRWFFDEIGLNVGVQDIRNALNTTQQIKLYNGGKITNFINVYMIEI